MNTQYASNMFTDLYLSTVMPPYMEVNGTFIFRVSKLKYSVSIPADPVIAQLAGRAGRISEVDLLKSIANGSVFAKMRGGPTNNLFYVLGEEKLERLRKGIAFWDIFESLRHSIEDAANVATGLEFKVNFDLLNSDSELKQFKIFDMTPGAVNKRLVCEATVNPFLTDALHVQYASNSGSTISSDFFRNVELTESIKAELRKHYNVA